MNEQTRVTNINFSQNAAVDFLQHVPEQIKRMFIWEVVRCIKWGSETTDEQVLDDYIMISYEGMLDVISAAALSWDDRDPHQQYQELLSVLTSFVSYGLSSEEIIEKVQSLDVDIDPSFIYRVDVKTGHFVLIL